MKISELIGRLNEIKNGQGDIRVCVSYDNSLFVVDDDIEITTLYMYLHEHQREQIEFLENLGVDTNEIICLIWES